MADADPSTNSRNPDRSQEILDAALALFSSRGYHATSMQDLADAVGLQKGSLYHYIRSKEDLLYPLIEAALEGYVGDLEAVRAGGGTAGEQLRRAVTAHVERVARFGDMMTVFISEGRHLKPEEQERVRSLAGRYRAMLEDLIREGVEAGEFRTSDPALAALALLGACNWLPQWFRPEGRSSPAEIAGVFIEVFLEGLASR
ncbi:MAG TPA: TetR/AcrR family transcriptional regulator [Bacillota bacterium]